jgi:hypothetical protein
MVGWWDGKGGHEGKRRENTKPTSPAKARDPNQNTGIGISLELRMILELELKNNDILPCHLGSGNHPNSEAVPHGTSRLDFNAKGLQET